MKQKHSTRRAFAPAMLKNKQKQKGYTMKSSSRIILAAAMLITFSLPPALRA
jgi:hypothetical protein